MSTGPQIRRRPIPNTGDGVFEVKLASKDIKLIGCQGLNLLLGGVKEKDVKCDVVMKKVMPSKGEEGDGENHHLRLHWAPVQ